MSGTFVKAVENAGNSGVVTFSPTNPGDLLVVLSNTSAGGGTPTASITDSLSSAWQTAIATFQEPNGSLLWESAFYLPNCPAGITSITLSYAGGPPGSTNIIVAEVSGIATASPLIISAHNSQAAPGTAANALTSGSANVGATICYVMGAVRNGGDSDTTAGTGFTNRYGNGTSNNWFIEDQRTSGSLAATARAPTHGATDTYTTFLLAFAEPDTLQGQIWL